MAQKSATLRSPLNLALSKYGEIFMDSDASKQSKRNIFIRIVLGIIWLVVTIFAGHILFGMVVGGLAGAGVHSAGLGLSGSYQAGSQAGSQATQEFFVNHGGKVFLLELLVWLILVVLGIYPGTSKYKKSNA